jgi:hypothetical protein
MASGMPDRGVLLLLLAMAAGMHERVVLMLLINHTWLAGLVHALACLSTEISWLESMEFDPSGGPRNMSCNDILRGLNRIQMVGTTINSLTPSLLDSAQCEGILGAILLR